MNLKVGDIQINENEARTNSDKFVVCYVVTINDLNISFSNIIIEVEEPEHTQSLFDVEYKN